MEPRSPPLSGSGFPFRIHSAVDAGNNAPDVALLAVVPTHGDNIDGASVGIEILKVAPRCSVLLFSGHSEAMTYIARAAEKGYHFELLAMPIPPTVLLSKVKELIECNCRDH